MAVKVETHEVPVNEGAYEIKHGLNSLYPHVSAWQNGFYVTPPVRVLDESTVAVYNLVTGGTVTLVADVPAKSSRSKSSASGKSE